MTDEPDPAEIGEVEQSIERAWPPEVWQNVHVAVALSGGPDSVALLRALAQIKARTGGSGRLLALHVNHQLRGDESDADARWCQALCQRLAIPLYVLPGRVEVAGDGLEAAARNERYHQLGQAAESAGARYVVTAHTRDDQVETILFRILRGTGLQGLSGMRIARRLTPSVSLVRPLLDCSRQLLIRYLDSLVQDYRVDSSNKDKQFARNRIRHELLPTLRTTYNSDIDNALLGLASQAAEAQQLVAAEAHKLLDQSIVNRKESPTSKKAGRGEAILLQLPDLSSTDSIVLCELLRIVWRNAGLAEQDMTRRWWLRLAKLAVDRNSPKVLTLPGGIRASTIAGELRLEW